MQRALSEPVLRFGVFIAVLAALALLEVWLGGPNPSPRRTRRWPANVGLALLDTLIARLLSPTGVSGAALWAQRAGIGLFNVVSWPSWLEFGLALLLLDLAIFWQHLLRRIMR